VQCTVYTPGVGCLTVAFRHFIFVRTELSLATVPTMPCASWAMHARVVHGPELGSADGADEATADGADDGAPAAVVEVVVDAHPARAKAASAAAINVRERFTVVPLP